MKKIFRNVITLSLFLAFANCAANVITLSNSKSVISPRTGKFKILYDTDDIKAEFLAKVVLYKLKKMGFKEENREPDFIVYVAYTVRPSVKENYSHHSTNTGPLIKYLKIVFGDKKKKLLWEGESFEESSCPNIIITSPELVTEIFQFYPQDFSNKETIHSRSNVETTEIRNAFPEENWACD
ncbi:hypothetical protein [Leptospira andrefontaineae]|uniref:DUF4136 domain-containing protein n=1 Tax=Leptospira andrefontaineae TaxID=2484976 RepID=A0A4R9H6G6_9LEPT|nr:hypothetical protein [Leptospira andrefontaineae]TGK41158.1 hypothetical protein EHO65_06925 [Leptospira andrefontaineae]